MISFSIDKQSGKVDAEGMSRPVDSIKKSKNNQPLALVLTSMEQSPTFASRLKRKLLSGPIFGGAYRLTKFRATTDEQTRMEKTASAIELMIHEFKLKLTKTDSTEKDGLPIKRASSSFWTRGTGISIIVTLILAAIGGAYKLGFDNGSVKFDKEKIDLQKTIDSLRQQIKEIEQSESDEIKRLKIENKNVWDTYYKVLDENE